MDFWNNIINLANEHKTSLDQIIYQNKQRITALKEEIDTLNASIDAVKEERKIVISQLALLTAALSAAQKDSTKLDKFVIAASKLNI